MNFELGINNLKVKVLNILVNMKNSFESAAPLFASTSHLQSR